MAFKREFKIIAIMMGIAIISISFAFMTITKSFAFENNSSTYRIFNVEIADLDSNNVAREDIQVRGTSLLFNVRLDQNNSKNSFYFKYKNVGNIDSQVVLLNKERIDKIHIFDYNDKPYYLSDFAYFTFKNAENNKNNEINYASDVSINDSLAAKSENLVEVKVRLKYDTELTKEQKEALDYYLTDHVIETPISIDLLYGEK